MRHRTAWLAAWLVCGAAAAQGGYDGVWRAELESAIGRQRFLFVLRVEGETVTGTATARVFDAKQRPNGLIDGALADSVLRFAEVIEFGGRQLRIAYTARLDGDVLRMTRQVGDFAAEEFTAERTTGDGDGWLDKPLGGRPMFPPTPRPGPAPLPVLPALPAPDDTSFYAAADVPHGQVQIVEYHTHDGRDKRLHIYLPPGYAESADRYPVLYLNHGMGGNDASWTSTDRGQGGSAQFILDNLLAAGRAKPMIVVMPDTSDIAALQPAPPGGENRCADEYLRDIIPYVEQHYRVVADRDHRALAGLSMGGMVVLNTGLPHLDVFSELYVYSSGFFAGDMDAYRRSFGEVVADPEVNQRLRVPIYLAVGEVDFALPASHRAMALLHEHEVRCFWVLSTGGHEWMNWRRYLWQSAQVMFPE